MKLETKYDIGQRLFSLTEASVQRPPVQCAACEGSGQVDLRGERYHCPLCNGRKTTQAHDRGWVVGASGCVGSIEVEHESLKDTTYYPSGYNFDDLALGSMITVVKYMLDSTGVGSGTVHYEPNLFHSRKEAQAECDRRNGYGAREAA